MTSTDYANPYRPLAIRLFNRIGRAGRSLDQPARLHVDSLIDSARRKTGLTDFGADGHLRALGVLVESINDEARLTATGRLMQRSRLSAALVSRLQIQELLRRHPEIDDIDLGRIVLVAGLQRTGTTLLQRLLSSHPEIRSITGPEVLHPVPDVDDVERGKRTRERRAVLAKRAFSYLAPEFTVIHPIDHDQPEEEVLLMDLTFMSQSAEATMHVPSYSRWLEGEDHTWTYEYLQRVLKVLCWQRPGRTWVLKTPQHMEHLDAFRTVFPEATIVQTHRDPRKTVASFCSLVAHARGMFSDCVDPFEIGEHWFRKTRRMVQRSAQAREDAGDRRFVDVSYYDLTRDPIAELRRICSRAGIAFDDVAELTATRCIEANPKDRFGKHVYRLSDFGLSEQMVDEAFSSYREKHAIPFE
ncbi:MAG: sulfotransferase [Acidimicrobiia bacterium]|nr:sulfotransferase [Acidimicrobiia bacterium]MYC45546.1 sulfotransferase [Acidimicrobiia bacterium]MYI18659.1 sulfotransferase [Acidimicrobiia bacterium]